MIACASPQLERESGVALLPWEAALYGVVSLMDMLEFSAHEYVEISHQFGLALASVCKKQPDGALISKSLGKLLEESNRLGLFVTREAVAQLILELVDMNPAGSTLSLNTDQPVIHIKNLALDNSRWSYHIECIHATLRAELKTIAFRVIPRNKVSHCDPNWLVGTEIYTHFPSAWSEFQAAGRCYAFGENTACAFHLQRALEWGLKSLAVRLGRRFDRNGWEKHLEDIEKELTARYKAEVSRSKEEKFYSETATQFGHMKVAWRNPTMHVEAKYDEKEAHYLLTTIEKFMDHLASSGLKEAQP